MAYNKLINKESFNVSSEEIKEFTQEFQSQCPILHELVKQRKYALAMMTVEHKNAYMQHYLLDFVAEWRRDRMDVDTKNDVNFQCTDIQSWLKNQPWRVFRSVDTEDSLIDHCKKLEDIELTNDYFIKKGIDYIAFYTAFDVVCSGLRALCGVSLLYNPLVAPPYPHPFRINDYLQSTVEYVCAAVEWIDDTIKTSKTSLFPFQIDLCIHYSNTINVKQGLLVNSDQETTAEQFDEALRRYYKAMGAEYANQFSLWCEENGFDHDTYEEEIGAGPFDCMLLEFDQHIPLQQEFEEEDEKYVAIHNLLWKIYHNASFDIKRPFNLNQMSKDKDTFGDIQAKLKEKMTKYAYINCDSNGVFYSNEFIALAWIRININLSWTDVAYTKDILCLLSEYMGNNPAPDVWSLQTHSFHKLFEKFTQQNSVNNNNNEYLKNKRMITFIDRRKSAQNIDTLWMFEPFKCATIPTDPVLPYWYFNASKTFLLPNNINVDNANAGDEKDGNNLLLTFSLHVTAPDSIKCFLYYVNGEMMQFTPDDISDILPHLFTSNLNATFDGSINAKFAKNKKSTSQIIEKMKQTLQPNRINFWNTDD